MKELFPAGGAILAPMAGVTDYAFREICAELGACATVTEMVSAKALCYGDKKTASLLRRNEGVPCGVQIFGSEPEFMARGVKVASVKDIACQRLVCEPVHGIDIMHVGIGDSVKNWNLRDDVHLGVNLDTRLRSSELRPGKERHTEIDCCGVHGIEPAVQLKLSCNPSLLRKEYHMEGKLLKDMVVSEIVSLGKRALVDGRLSESEMKRLLSMSSCYICEFSQPFAAHELSEHKDEKLAPRRRSPILGSVAGLGHKAFEIPLWQEAGYLSENVLSEMHIYTKFDLAAKVRISKVRQGFRNLLYCA